MRQPIWEALYNLCKATSCRSTDLSWLLGASCDGCELLDILLGHLTHFPGPLGALGVGGVARRLILTLLLQLSPALHDIINNIMLFILGPTL